LIFDFESFFFLKEGLGLKATYSYSDLKILLNSVLAEKEELVHNELRTHSFSLGPIWGKSVLQGFYKGVLFGAQVGEKIEAIKDDPNTRLSLTSIYLTPLLGYAWMSSTNFLSNVDLGLLLGSQMLINQETQEERTQALTRLKLNYYIGFSF
jgi:hypothetical protein